VNVWSRGSLLYVYELSAKFLTSGQIGMVAIDSHYVSDAFAGW
jgi:hypothetical protein